MKRREFITLLGVAAAAWPLAARAQQAGTQRRIAIFHPAIPTTLLTETGGGSAWRAFFAELRRLGYSEGENLIIERYSAEGHHERYADLARQIVARRPDVIVTGTNPVVIAFKAATSTIPVVAFMLDPLHAGLVTSLGRPGGNLTGITLDAGIEIWGKRLQILKEAIPSTTKAAFLGMREGWEGASGQALRDAGGRLGISLVFMLPQQGTPSEIAPRPHREIPTTTMMTRSKTKRMRTRTSPTSRRSSANPTKISRHGTLSHRALSVGGAVDQRHVLRLE
jgi:putative ABC transport system substrate-binding protein